MKMEDQKALYQAPHTKSQLKYGGQGVMVFGLGMCVWALCLVVEGYHFEFTGRAGMNEKLIVAVFGLDLGAKVTTGLIAAFGIASSHWGWKTWRASITANSAP